MKPLKDWTNLMNDLQNIYEKLNKKYSEEEIQEHFILFVIDGLNQKKEQYKNNKENNKLLDLFYKLIELKD